MAAAAKIADRKPSGSWTGRPFIDKFGGILDRLGLNGARILLLQPLQEEVGAYLCQPEFLHQGQPRTVVLSEQGFHTPDYSERSFLDKAAAIAYTWQKITHLPSVETFHYHRWVDHPDEGGLKVGLRTLPVPGQPFGVRKEPAFSVFSALETKHESAAAEPLKKIIGIEDWASVRIPAETIKKN